MVPYVSQHGLDSGKPPSRKLKIKGYMMAKYLVVTLNMTYALICALISVSVPFWLNERAERRWRFILRVAFCGLKKG